MNANDRPQLVMVGALVLVGRLTPMPWRLHDPAQLMPLPMPNGQIAWIVLPLPAPELVMAGEPLAAGPVDDHTAQQYADQLAAVKAAKSGLTLPGNGPRQRPRLS